MRYIKLTVIAAAFAAFVIACGPSASNVAVTPGKNGNTQAVPNVTAQNKPAEVNTPSTPVETSSDISGKELYAINCQICHKDTGKGGKVTVEGKNLNVDDLTSAKMAKRSDEKLEKGVSDGVPDEGMPSFAEKLKPEEIKAIIGHVRTLQMP